MMIKIDIPGLPVMQSGTFGVKWSRRKHDQRWKDEVFWALTGQRPAAPIEFAYVHCVRYSGSSKPPDDANLRSSFKAPIDALQLGQRPVIVNDDPLHMKDTYEWQPCARNAGHITMEISDKPISPQARERAL